MPSQPRHPPEQEHSIKARSHALFIEEDLIAGPAPATRPFRDYLRETPAQPLSPGVKAILWVVGIVVAALFVLAIWRLAHHPTARVRSAVEGARPAEAPG